MCDSISVLHYEWRKQVFSVFNEIKCVSSPFFTNLWNLTLLRTSMRSRLKLEAVAISILLIPLKLLLHNIIVGIDYCTLFNFILRDIISVRVVTHPMITTGTMSDLEVI